VRTTLLPGRFLQPVAENRARGMNIFARLNMRHPRGAPRLGTTERARVLSTTMALATDNGLAGVSLRLISEKCGLPLADVKRSFGDLDNVLVVAAVSGAQDRVVGAEDCSTPDQLADLEMSLLHHFHRNRSVYAELLSSPLAARVSAGLSAVGRPLEQANMRLFQRTDLTPGELNEVSTFLTERIKRMVTAWLTEPNPSETPETIQANLQRFVEHLVEIRPTR
jgi:AcrR family transcriptional regulator